MWLDDVTTVLRLPVSAPPARKGMAFIFEIGERARGPCRAPQAISKPQSVELKYPATDDGRIFVHGILVPRMRQQPTR